ncbi:MAG: hypothetical protein ACE5HF_08080 [Gemmatimonadota bacterium]
MTPRGRDRCAGAPGIRLALAVAALAVGLPGSVRAQEEAAGRGEADGGHPTRFSSIDVELGGAAIDGAQLGISYGAGFDIANLFVPGALTRFGFRFWATEDRTAAGRRIEINDFAFGFMIRKRFGSEGFAALVGLGPGLHLVSAGFPDRIGETEERDGAKAGLDASIGIEISIGDDGFASVFSEGTASLVSRVSHASILAGIRLRFDRLGRLR